MGRIFQPSNPTGRQRRDTYVKSYRIAAVILAILLLVPFAGHARELQPANDDMAQATPVTSLPFHSQHDLLLATQELNEPSCGGFGHTVWYSFKPGEDTDVRLDWYGSVVGVFAGTSFQDFETIECGNYGDLIFTAKA